MARQEQKQRKGQLPDFIFEQYGFFFGARWDDEVLYYETKWSPNTEVIMEIAIRFDVAFVHSYEESSNLIYGEASFDGGIFTETCLDSEDFDQYEYNEETDTYLFDEKHYESDFEILDIILERKKAIKNLQQS